MDFHRVSAVRAGFLVVAGVVTVALSAGCPGDGPSRATGSPSNQAASTPATVTNTPERPRHRVDETDAERRALIEPFERCMRDHGADLNSMPPDIEEAGRWMAEHSSAARACEPLVPLPPWGLDPANPEFRNNIHQWVKCMNDRGLKIIATPDDPERPWRYAGESTLSPEESSEVELECEKETIGRFDK